MSNNEIFYEESDKLSIMPLGAGQEVGRSCILLTFKGKKIILDCGIHPGLRHKDSLPFIDAIPNIENTDLILLLFINSFHLDHCGGLPYLLLKTGAKAKCFMTHATKAIYRYLLADFVRISTSNATGEQSLYNDSDIIASLKNIDTIDFHQECEVNGIKFTAYHAGHVLGAAMFQIEIAGVKVLYTGDFSRQEDRHLMSAEIPPFRPDVLITEATYGIHIHDKREERESRFTKIVHDIVARGGRCLIPAFALGRAQELMLILDEYWDAHPELHDVPIYYASQLARKCMAVYQTYIHAMNDRIKKQIANNNPFVFRHISNLKSIDHFDDSGPCVIMASPGMLQSGLSRELFESWCTDTRNGVIIAGYCVEGTLAKQILSLPNEITSLSGQSLPLKCSVDYISFSAHTDYQQTSEFIRELHPTHVVMVHGEEMEMSRLCSALKREYEDADEDEYGGQPIDFYMPKNCETVNLKFRGEKIVKVLGSLAKDPPKQGKHISGVLSLNIPYHGPASLLKFHLTLLAGKVDTVKERSSSAEYRAFDCIQVYWKPDNVNLKWESSPTNDMYADSLQSLILRLGIQFKAGHDEIKRLKSFSFENYRENLKELLQDAFGEECFTPLAERKQTQSKKKEEAEENPDSPIPEGIEVEDDEADIVIKKPKREETQFKIYVDDWIVDVDLKTLNASCNKNPKLAHTVQTMAQRLHNCLAPV
ncbi:Cleavage and polyadenylation specificity factor subunit 3 [Cichlidogyrus casuarinus]|uniref:Cleavage and polyadenylation specificity factor subunit 3 n=1 Tax=Cichlidogyrus casuarinus TaxID=1844966 RepID=A0ABD2QF12_9PLAT